MRCRQYIVTIFRVAHVKAIVDADFDVGVDL
jgi:hypothetical protein